MGRLSLGLAVVLTLIIGAPGASVAAPAVPKEARTQGMKDAPAVVSAAGLECQVSDARKIGEGTDPTTKTKQTLYEVACTGGEGMVLVKTGEAARAFTCLQADQVGPDGKPSTVNCMLPGNLDPKAGIIPLVAKAGVTCTPDRLRVMGQTPDATFIEVSCPNTGGWILKTSAPPKLSQPATAIPCVSQPETSNIHCTLTDRAAQLAVVDRLSQSSGKPCVIKDRGYVAAAQDGRVFYEESCQDGKGFMLVQAANGSLERAMPCAEADSFFGGCKLTDSRQAKTEQASLYTDLSRKAGYPCQVAGYAPLPPSTLAPNDEVVELVCKDADGAVGFFAPSGGRSAVYDCATAEMLGYRCSLSKGTGYAKLTADLKAVGKTTCTVSTGRFVGVTTDRKGFMEVGCSDGLAGYMIEYQIAVPGDLKPTDAILCAQAGNIAGGCVLPGNRKKT